MGLWGTPWGGVWGATRTAYHVKISGDDVTGDGSETNPWRTIAYGISQIAPGPTNSFDSSLEELWVWYDPVTPYTEILTLPAGKPGIRVIGVDTNGHPAYHADWVRDEKVLLVFPAGAYGIDVNTNNANWAHFQGFELDGGSLVAYPIICGIIKVTDSLIRDSPRHGIRAATGVGGCFFERVEFLDNAWAAVDFGATANNEARACFVKSCGYGFVSNGICLFENCTVQQCTDAAQSAYQCVSSSVIYRNCFAFNNAGPYGFANDGGPTLEGCASYRSVPAVFHRSGNYKNAPGGDNIEGDEIPEIDAATNAPIVGSPLFRSGNSGATTERDVYGSTYYTPTPTRGAIVGVFQPRYLIVKGRNLVHVDFSSLMSFGSFADLLTINAWSIDPLPPRISTIEELAGDILAIRTDRPLLQGALYTLEALVGDFEGASWEGYGLRLAPEASRTERADLLDIDAPVVRPDRPGGDWTIDETGDYKLTGGVATVLKMVWDVVLTEYDELLWAPGYGARLQHKRPAALGLRLQDERQRLRRLIEEVPHVEAAAIDVEVESDHARISIALRTSFGKVQTTKEVGP